MQFKTNTQDLLFASALCLLHLQYYYLHMHCVLLQNCCTLCTA